MPLQNRVDPFGRPHAVAARGLFTGNRGLIHDPDTRTLLKRGWTTKTWIICDCGFKGRKRDVFGRNTRSGGAGWTNLFFLDEVTALAAGHRPCFECRREAAKAYAEAFGRAFDIVRPRVKDMDDRLHGERLAVHNVERVLTRQEIAALPDGAMVAAAGHSYALLDRHALPWVFAGYGPAMPLNRLATPATLITPPATVATLRAGFAPVWHHSAQASVD